jgi:site-specific DNA-methyltransferase (adenine-specific)
MMNGLPPWWPDKRPFAIIDCIEGMAFIPDGVVDLVVTDPPYSGGFPFNWNAKNMKGGKQTHRKTIVGNDNLVWLEPAVAEMFRVLKPDAWCVCFGSWRMYCQFAEKFAKAGFEHKTVGVWDKGLLGMGQGIAEEYEQIYFFKKGNPEQTVRRGNVFRFMRHIQTDEHPNIKPVELIAELVRLCSKRRGVVLDPFLGSGTTLLACRHTDRVGLGFEIDPQYEETIIKRAIISTLPLDRWVTA